MAGTAKQEERFKWMANQRADAAEKRLDQIAAIIEEVDDRCMACDGPVGDTLREMTSAEIRKIYRLAKGSKRKRCTPVWGTCDMATGHKGPHRSNR